MKVCYVGEILPNQWEHGNTYFCKIKKDLYLRGLFFMKVETKEN